MNQPVVLPCCDPLSHNPIVLLSVFTAVECSKTLFKLRHTYH